MQEFRLLHLSDLHVCASPLQNLVAGWPKVRSYLSRYESEIVAAIAKQAWHNREHLDAIVFTGDLADTALAEDLQLAERLFAVQTKPVGLKRSQGFCEWLDTDALPIFSQLGSRVRTVVMPGNHDRFEMPFNPRRSNAFNVTFNSRWQPDQFGIQVCDVMNRKNEILRLIAADFTLREIEHATSELDALGQGRVYEDTLEQLKSLTLDARSQGIPVVWMSHFPSRFPTKMREMELLEKNDKALVRVAQECQVSRILCGHRHVRLIYPGAVDPHVWFHASGTAGVKTQDGNTAAHWLEIEVNDGHIAAVTATDWVCDYRQKNWGVEAREPVVHRTVAQ